MSLYFLTYEAHLLNKCKANCLWHHHFWAAGINDIWAIDQHDNWLWFGLALHTGIEPFSGCILWVKVWHSNQNLQLILSYYLEMVEDFGHKHLTCILFLLLSHCWHACILLDIPMVTQSDPGTENLRSQMCRPYCGKCMISPLKASSNTNGCTPRRTSCWKLHGHNSDNVSPLKPSLIQVWMLADMILTTPYSCEYNRCIHNIVMSI